MKYNIKLESFEGPLDLLLHLISNAKINIEDVSIADITEQYLDYLNRMREFDIEIASEFLVMASDLLYIKSRALLPKPIPLEEESDPEEELRLRLIEYRKFKEISRVLSENEKTYSKVYYKLPEELLSRDKENLIPMLKGDKKDLKEILEKLMAEKRFVKPPSMVYRIEKKPISIGQKVRELRGVLHNSPQCSFFMLFHGDYDRGDIVITFLALLEMLRTNQVRVHQEKQFQDIIIRRIK